MPVRPKLIYIARRNPALSLEEFTPRWRQHGALGMSRPRWTNVWRYTHADVLRGAGIAGVSEDHDGIGTVWHRSPEARLAHRSDRSSQGTMEADELATFDRLIAYDCAIYSEEVGIVPHKGARIRLVRCFVDAKRDEEGIEPLPFRGGVGVGKLAVSECLRHPEALPPAPPLKWRGDIRGQVSDYARLDRVAGFIRNRRAPPEVAPWGLGFEQIDELWFDDVAAAVAAAAQLADYPGDLTLLAREIVLYRLTEDA